MEVEPLPSSTAPELWTEGDKYPCSIPAATDRLRLSLAIQGNSTSFCKRLVEHISRAEFEKPARYDAV